MHRSATVAGPAPPGPYSAPLDGDAARKLDQAAARKVIHRKGVHSTPIWDGDSKTDPSFSCLRWTARAGLGRRAPTESAKLHMSKLGYDVRRLMWTTRDRDVSACDSFCLSW